MESISTQGKQEMIQSTPIYSNTSSNSREGKEPLYDYENGSTSLFAHSKSNTSTESRDLNGGYSYLSHDDPKNYGRQGWKSNLNTPGLRGDPLGENDGRTPRLFKDLSDSSISSSSVTRQFDVFLTSVNHLKEDKRKLIQENEALRRFCSQLQGKNTGHEDVATENLKLHTESRSDTQDDDNLSTRVVLSTDNCQDSCDDGHTRPAGVNDSKNWPCQDLSMSGDDNREINRHLQEFQNLVKNISSKRSEGDEEVGQLRSQCGQLEKQLEEAHEQLESAQLDYQQMVHWEKFFRTTMLESYWATFDQLREELLQDTAEAQFNSAEAYKNHITDTLDLKLQVLRSRQLAFQAATDQKILDFEAKYSGQLSNDGLRGRRNHRYTKSFALAKGSSLNDIPKGMETFARKIEMLEKENENLINEISRYNVNQLIDDFHDEIDDDDDGEHDGIKDGKFVYPNDVDDIENQNDASLDRSCSEKLETIEEANSCGDFESEHVDTRGNESIRPTLGDDDDVDEECNANVSSDSNSHIEFDGGVAVAPADIMNAYQSNRNSVNLKVKSGITPRSDRAWQATAATEKTTSVMMTSSIQSSESKTTESSLRREHSSASSVKDKETGSPDTLESGEDAQGDAEPLSSMMPKLNLETVLKRSRAPKRGRGISRGNESANSSHKNTTIDDSTEVREQTSRVGVIPSSNSSVESRNRNNLRSISSLVAKKLGMKFWRSHHDENSSRDGSGSDNGLKFTNSLQHPINNGGNIFDGFRGMTQSTTSSKKPVKENGIHSMSVGVAGRINKKMRDSNGYVPSQIEYYDELDDDNVEVDIVHRDNHDELLEGSSTWTAEDLSLDESGTMEWEEKTVSKKIIMSPKPHFATLDLGICSVCSTDAKSQSRGTNLLPGTRSSVCMCSQTIQDGSYKEDQDGDDGRATSARLDHKRAKTIGMANFDDLFANFEYSYETSHNKNKQARR